MLSRRNRITYTREFSMFSIWSIGKSRDSALTEISFETYLPRKLRLRGWETFRAEKTSSSNSSKRILLKYFQSRAPVQLLFKYDM